MGFKSTCLTAALLAAAASGCVERTLSITSEPRGALVYLNDEEVGRTPLEVPFTFYGTYDVRLEAAGHKPLWTMQEAKAPFWETPGIDLFAEMVPNGQSRIDWHFEMQPEVDAEDADVDQLLNHARQMRAMTQREE